MRAAVMYGPGDVQIVQAPDPKIELPTDAVVRVVCAAICGSDLWLYDRLPPTAAGFRLGHEFVAVVEEIGSQVTTVQRGDFVVASFKWSDGTCEFCTEGLQTSCLNGGSWGGQLDGGQGEAVRVPFADGTLLPVPIDANDPRTRAVLTLADVMATGHHAAVCAKVGPRTTVAVIGDGAVGLCAVLAAARLGAERIIMLGGHANRTALARSFGASDVVAERGDEAVQQVLDLTGGRGAHAVLECVGTGLALRTALDIARPGGTVGYVGLPQDETGIDARRFYARNISIAGGLAPVRSYIPYLLPDVLCGKLDPSAVFDHETDLDGVPSGYQAMAERSALKVLVRP
jgi:threonine dehydrogenase-like Zn-dependent dehydrogenase